MYKLFKRITCYFMVLALIFSSFNTDYIKLSDNVYAAEQNAPTQLQFSKSGNAKTITWNAVSGATGYNIYRSNSRYGSYSRISTVSATSYMDNTAGSYYYKVRTQFNGWESGDSDPISEEIQLFGNNVYVFDTNDDQSQVQSILSGTWSKQETNQFGSERYAFFFKPGNYSSLDFKVGFYTQVSGLGLKPTDTHVGKMNCTATWLGGDSNHNATCNFWRMAENLTVDSNMMWATSQAVSLRRMQINGKLDLHDNGGWASGGFLADSKITGSTNSGSQQQWISRNTEWASWSGSNWNMNFVGCTNTPSEDGQAHYTPIAQTPDSYEKPFLVYNNGEYGIFVPERRTNSKGVSWSGNNNGEFISIDKCFAAKPTDSVDTINAQLAQGKHLIFTPGIYNINKPIEVKNKNTVVLGIGLASLKSTNGNVCIKTADADGIKIAGLLFDAGTQNTRTMLQIGESGASRSHASNPIFVGDVFFRVGGVENKSTSADTCVVINSNDVIGDNFWVWRADHTWGVGWNTNKTTNGIIVNGDNFTVYGLMVEHFHQYQTVWNGNGGRTYMYQSEMPYDVPNQSSWQHNGVNGYASYKVADNVTSHQAYGLGMYLYNRDAAVTQNTVMEVPDVAGVTVHNICSVMLTGNPGTDHVINNTGGGVYNGGARQYIVDYGSGVAAPTIEPSNECYREAQSIVLKTNTTGATIRYTTDGSTPSRTNGQTYTGPFKLNNSATVKAMAYADGKTDSVVSSKEISIGDIALNKPVTVSSTVSTNAKMQNADYTADKITDGNKTKDACRWESEWSDNQWATVDLQKNYNLKEIKLTWEAASASDYTVQVSTDNNNWETVQTVTNGAQGAVLDVNNVNKTARYIKVNMTKRATSYGNSLYELEAYGDPTDGVVEKTAEQGSAFAGEEISGNSAVTTIPGTVNIANYSDASSGVTVGTYAGNFTNGSSISFKVNATGGNYRMTLPLAAEVGQYNATNVLVSVDGNQVANITLAGLNGWETFVNHTAEFYLSEGKHTISLATSGGGGACNMNSFNMKLTKADEVETTTPEVATTKEEATQGSVKTFNPVTVPETGSSNNSGSKLCVGYLPNWSASGFYQNINWSALTHICLAFCNPDTNGNLSYAYDGTETLTKNIVETAHRNGVKVIASLGGADYGRNYAALVTPSRMDSFNDQIIAFAKKYNLDGIDIDIEGDSSVADSVWNNYEAWIKGLSQKCHDNNLLFTTAVGNWYLYRISSTTLSYFDYVMPMEYDCSASNYRIQGYLDKGVPASKLVLGAPFYGDGPYTAYKDLSAANKTNLYNRVKGITELSKNYAGTMIWELTQDTNNATMLTMVKDTLYDGQSAPRDESTGGVIATDVPGTVKVKDYFDKSSAITFTTSVAGVTYAGGLNNNSYLDFYVNVPQAGSYTINLPLAAGDAQWNADSITVKVNDSELATLPITGSTGWETFINHTCKFNASAAGAYKISVAAVGGAVNIADFNITRNGEIETAETTTKATETTKAVDTEIEKPFGLVADCPADGTIGVVWGSGNINMYNVYIDNQLVASGVTCAYYRYEGYSAGTHTVAVTVSYNGKESAREETTVVVTGNAITTKEPETTTQAPETTKAPEETTTQATETTKEPETTTQAPEETTKAPVSDITEWNENTIYVGGNRVSYNGNIYQAKWWTVGDNPETCGQWGVWSLVESVAVETTQAPETTTQESVTEKAIEIPVDSYTSKTDTIVIYERNDGIKYAGQLLDGSYLEYDISVKEAGKYTFKVDLAGINEGRQLTITANGIELATINPTVSGGWTTFDSYSTTIEFASAGTVKLRLTSNGSLNIANVAVTEYVKAVAATDIIDTKSADQYSGKSGEVTLMTADDGTSYAGNFVDGSYIEYQVNVIRAGTYKLFMDVAGIYEGIQFSILEGEQKLGTIVTAPTSGWTTFETYSTDVTFDSEGTKTIRIATNGAMNIANLKLTK